MLIVAEVTDPELGEGLCRALHGWPGDVLLADATPLGLRGRVPEGVRLHRRRPPLLLGLAGAWNLGLRAIGYGARVVLLHERTRLTGRKIARLAERHDDPVVHLEGWALTILTRAAVSEVGLLDENLWPVAGVTEDWSRRAELAGVEVARLGDTAWELPPLPPPAGTYYRAKWGGPPGGEVAELPFGDRPLAWWPRGATWRTWIDHTGRDRRVLTEGVDAPALLREWAAGHG